MRPESRRNCIIQEIIESEKQYLNLLDVLIRYFMDPLSTSGVVSKKDHKILFGEIRTIRLINQVLSDHLASGDILGAFASLTPFLKLYSSYARNFPSSQELLSNLSQHKKFSQWVQTQESNPGVKGLKLPALLITPIQRIPRYKLLLGELLKAGDETEEDEQLIGIHCEIECLAEQINECVQEYENSLQILEIQKNLDSAAPKLLMPGRRFIKKGKIKKISKHGNPAVLQDRFFWLFTDILLYGKGHPRKRGHFRCSCVLPLRHCSVHRRLGTNDFTITCKEDSVHLRCDSFADADSWVTTLSESIVVAQNTRQTLRKESSKRVPLHRPHLLRAAQRRTSSLSYKVKHRSSQQMSTLPLEKEEIKAEAGPSRVLGVISNIGSLFHRKRSAPVSVPTLLRKDPLPPPRKRRTLQPQPRPLSILHEESFESEPNSKRSSVASTYSTATSSGSFAKHWWEEETIPEETAVKQSASSFSYCNLM